MKSAAAGQAKISGCWSVGGSPDEGNRINPLTILQHFKVQVGPGSASGFTHQGNYLAFFHFLTNCDQVPLVVRVPGRIAVSMVDFDEVAKTVPF